MSFGLNRNTRRTNRPGSRSTQPAGPLLDLIGYWRDQSETVLLAKFVLKKTLPLLIDTLKLSHLSVPPNASFAGNQPENFFLMERAQY